MSEPHLLWVAIAVLSLLAVLLLLPIRRRAAPPARADYDLAVYRDQLRELERDLERGAIAAPEAAAARTEIERRMLRAAGAPGTQPSSPASPRRIGAAMIALVLAVPAVALLAYLQLGAPGVPSVPLALRQRIEAEQRAEREQFAKLAAQLAERMEQHPGDPRGWQMLGRAYRILDRYEDSVAAYRRALTVAGGEDAASAELLADYGEALVYRAGGTVPEEAAEIFRKAAARDPALLKPRHYLATALVQAGDAAGALAILRGIEADAEPDAPWLPMLRERIAALAEEAGAGAGTAAARGPDRETMAAAAAMPPAEREAFIRSMVERLADRLAANPDDPEGWLRLGRARTVLGEEDAARDAFGRAAAIWRARLEALPPGAPERAPLERRLKQLDGLS